MLLYNYLTRPSLANQSNQKFTLLSLVDESVYLKDRTFDDATLPNEVVIPVPSKNGMYIKEQMINRIKWYVDKINYADDVIITRLDSDDVVHEDFIKNIQLSLDGEKYNSTYVDIADSYNFNLKTLEARKSNKYDTIVSPFVSVRESIRDFKCIPYYYEHTEIPKYCLGIKRGSIKAMQVIHDDNLINQTMGEVIKLDKTKYGM